MGEELLWAKLERELARLAEDFRGVAGIALQDLTNGRSVKILPAEPFAAGTLLKLGVLAALADAGARGEVDLDQRVIIPPGTGAAAPGLLNRMAGESDLALRDVAGLMVLLSDNLAANICIDLLGLAPINQFFGRLGLKGSMLRHTFDLSHSLGDENENVTTAEDMLLLMTALYRQDHLPADAAAFALRVLQRQRKGFFNKAIKDVRLANKPGTSVGLVRHDCGLVYLPGRPYALVVMTKYGDAHTNEQFVTDVARIVHDRYMTPLSLSNRTGGAVSSTARSQSAGR